MKELIITTLLAILTGCLILVFVFCSISAYKEFSPKIVGIFADPKTCETNMQVQESDNNSGLYVGHDASYPATTGFYNTAIGYRELRAYSDNNTNTVISK